MSNQKRRTQSSRKQFTGKQLILAQRSRSIKASLLKSLSLLAPRSAFDLAALYYLNSQREDRNCQAREAPATKPANLESQPSAIDRQLEGGKEPYSQLLNEREPAAPSSENKQLQPSAVPQLEQQTDKPQTTVTVTLLIARCIAFLIGLLIHYVISLFFPHLLILLSGIAFSAKRNCRATATNGATIYAPVTGEAQVDRTSCILFSGTEVPGYLFRLCGLKAPQLGQRRRGQSLGNADLFVFATFRKQPDGTWAFVEPSRAIVERTLKLN